MPAKPAHCLWPKPLTFDLKVLTMPQNTNHANEPKIPAPGSTRAWARRPSVHFTPRANWMNDPNGLVYYQGEYHLFYQYNPQGEHWGHLSWGHAVSRDLVHWEELPPALLEDAEWMIFSGSAVLDVHNTSGLGEPDNPPLVALYTGQRQKPGRGQNQQLAHSLDLGRTWTKYPGNPVLDEGKDDFRDPKVFWHASTKRWIMVLALPTEFALALYSSENLIQWRFLSRFECPEGCRGIWECPDLFPLTVDGDFTQQKWVLKIDLGVGGIGAATGGTGGFYFIGDFDGQRFTPDPKALPSPLTQTQDLPYQWVDYGKDFYAAVTWSNMPVADGRRIWIGWMNDWQYSDAFPSSPWRSCMSLPRSLGLTPCRGGLTLVQTPVIQIDKLRGTEQSLELFAIGEGRQPIPLSHPTDQALELELRFSLGQAEEFGLILDAGQGESIRLGYHTDRQELFLDRRHAGEDIDPDFPGIHRAPVEPIKGLLELQVIIDHCALEVFAQGGRVTLSDMVFPKESHYRLDLYSLGGTTRLKQGWVRTLLPPE